MEDDQSRELIEVPSHGYIDYSAAPTATQSIDVVNGPDAITSANHATATVGSSLHFPVNTTGAPTPVLKLVGKLPKGLALVDNHDGTGTLLGTPAANTGKTYICAIEATFGTGKTKHVIEQTFTLTVDQAPAITTKASTTVHVGKLFIFNVKTSGYPTSSLTESGLLPTGVSFTDNGNGTATLAGIPATGSAGTYPITITASNGVGSGATQNFSLVVKS